MVGRGDAVEPVLKLVRRPSGRARPKTAMRVLPGETSAQRARRRPTGWRVFASPETAQATD